MRNGVSVLVEGSEVLVNFVFKVVIIVCSVVFVELLVFNCVVVFVGMVSGVVVVGCVGEMLVVVLFSVVEML